MQTTGVTEFWADSLVAPSGVQALAVVGAATELPNWDLSEHAPIGVDRARKATVPATLTRTRPALRALA